MNLFGSNSNWRVRSSNRRAYQSDLPPPSSNSLQGPVWLAINYLLVEKLGVLHKCLGDPYTVEFPVRSGRQTSLGTITHDLAQRMLGIFRTDPARGGIRPTDGEGPAAEFFSRHPRFAPYVPFYEYFDGDTGRGLGASHQTGWTALVAKLLQHRSDVRRGHWLASISQDLNTLTLL